MIDELMCSTPYGIKGIFIILSNITKKKSLSAQRLTASKEYSYIRFLPLSYLARFVLNALRHQRNIHVFPANFHIFFPVKCSTPYGIKGIFICPFGQIGIPI